VPVPPGTIPASPLSTTASSGLRRGPSARWLLPTQPSAEARLSAPGSACLRTPVLRPWPARAVCWPGPPAGCRVDRDGPGPVNLDCFLAALVAAGVLDAAQLGCLAGLVALGAGMLPRDVAVPCARSWPPQHRVHDLRFYRRQRRVLARRARPYGFRLDRGSRPGRARHRALAGTPAVPGRRRAGKQGPAAEAAACRAAARRGGGQPTGPLAGVVARVTRSATMAANWAGTSSQAK
jgi:hypothetical protein